MFICKCKGCGKKPEEIPEYVELAKDYDYPSAMIAVIEEEGTYNPRTKAFYCTPCYIKAGMPLGKA